MADRILIVEDEEKLNRMIELELKYEGYETGKTLDGRTGLDMALSGGYDLVLLDIMLPGLNGLEVLRRIRKENERLPVILLTARDTTMDKVSGLDSGADDYVTKPFAIEELLARIRTALRKHAKAAAAPGQRHRGEADPEGVRPAGVPDGAPGQGHGPLVPAGAGVGLRLCRRDQLGGRGCPIPAQQDRRALWADPH